MSFPSNPKRIQKWPWFVLHKLCAHFIFPPYDRWERESVCVCVCVCVHLCLYVSVCTRVCPGQLKYSKGDPAPPAPCVYLCPPTPKPLSPIFSFFIWFTPACVSVGGEPSDQISRNFGHSPHTWTVSLPCVFGNASSAHRSGRTSMCSHPRCIYMAFPLEKKTENSAKPSCKSWVQYWTATQPSPKCQYLMMQQ